MSDPPTLPEGKTYAPNHVPEGERIWHIVLSVALLLYVGYGLWIDDLFIPGKRSRGVHMHGFAAWIMGIAAVFAVANMISVVVDHYDRRNNETDYKAFARLTAIAGWAMFGLSLVVHVGGGGR